MQWKQFYAGAVLRLRCKTAITDECSRSHHGAASAALQAHPGRVRRQRPRITVHHRSTAAHRRIDTAHSTAPLKGGRLVGAAAAVAPARREERRYVREAGAVAANMVLLCAALVSVVLLGGPAAATSDAASKGRSKDAAHALAALNTQSLGEKERQVPCEGLGA